MLLVDINKPLDTTLGEPRNVTKAKARMCHDKGVDYPIRLGEVVGWDPLSSLKAVDQVLEACLGRQFQTIETLLKIQEQSIHTEDMRKIE